MITQMVRVWNAGMEDQFFGPFPTAEEAWDYADKIRPNYSGAEVVYLYPPT